MAECEYIEACRMAYGGEGCKPACDLDLPCILYKPKVDRDALLALADEMEADGIDCYTVSTQYVLDEYAQRIREACGVSE